MRSKSFDGMVCSIAGVMGAIGDRWGLLVLRDLVCGIRRYDDFRKSSGITNATLSDRLKHLETGGLVERRLYQSNPERFEYQLTKKGWQIAPLMPVLAQIGDGWKVSGASGPPLKFTNSATGGEVEWGFYDRKSGQQVNPQNIAITPGPGANDLVRWRLSHRQRQKDEPRPQSKRAGKQRA